VNEVQEFNWPPIIKHGGIDDHFLVGEFYLRSNHQTSHSRVVVRFTRYQIGVSMAKFKVVIEVWNKILKRWDHHPSCLGTIHNKIGPSVSFMTDDEARNLWDDCCFNDKFTQFIPMTNIEIDRDFPTTLHEDMPSLEEVEREDWKAYNNY
tara:strand:+ start:162 stop:611 length:450 start_codon:yes stop_codon:yes gene_type:complete